MFKKTIKGKRKELEKIVKQIHKLRPDLSEREIIQEAHEGGGSLHLHLNRFLYNASRGEMLPFERGPLVDALNSVFLQTGTSLATMYQRLCHKVTHAFGIEKGRNMIEKATGSRKTCYRSLSIKEGDICHEKIHELTKLLEKH